MKWTKNLLAASAVLIIALAPLAGLAKLSCDPIHSYAFQRAFEVEGRQGIATDGEYLYVSGSTILYKYSMDGTLILKNDHPFDRLEKACNHIGDIDVYNNEIYAGCETFIDGQGKNIQVAIYDAGTLEYKRSIDWNPNSGQVEVCGLTVDVKNNAVWMADWVGGRYLYHYDLTTGDYTGKLHLQPVPQYQQGIFCWDGYIYITADDGDAEDDEYDHLYRVEANTSITAAPVYLEKTFTEVTRTGEIEGLTVNPKTGEFMVMFNRGTRVILGMPRGFYPGYDHEIHEIYVYGVTE